MNHRRWIGLFSVVVLAVAGAFVPGSGPAPAAAATGGWKLTWADEFNQRAGTAPDPRKWVYDLGGEPQWGNGEWQYYTKRSANVAQDGKGHLVLTARKEKLAGMAGCDYGTCDITSARITTKGKFAQTYGRFEARIQIPAGKGMWPAFWMLGDYANQAAWPACGEIDIMEAIGSAPGTVEGTGHGSGFPAGGMGGDWTQPGGKSLSSGFHVFGVLWNTSTIVWYVDGVKYYTLRKADLPRGATWAFDHPFYLLLNLAVGGEMPGSPNASTRYPSRMVVDYVRAYRRV